MRVGGAGCKHRGRTRSHTRPPAGSPGSGVSRTGVSSGASDDDAKLLQIGNAVRPPWRVSSWRRWRPSSVEPTSTTHRDFRIRILYCILRVSAVLRP